MRSKDPQLLDAVLKFVNGYYREYHDSPTTRQVAAGVGVAEATARRYLVELSDTGMLDYEHGIQSAPESAKCMTGYRAAPLVGSVRCGDPTAEEEYVEEYVSLPESIFGKGTLYILRASGRSMIDAGIDDGDLVVIRKTEEAEKGSIIVALDEFGQNTLKRYGGYDPETGSYLLEYMNEKEYPGKVIRVKQLTVQGVAKRVIKDLEKLTE